MKKGEKPHRLEMDNAADAGNACRISWKGVNMEFSLEMPQMLEMVVYWRI